MLVIMFIIYVFYVYKKFNVFYPLFNIITTTKNKYFFLKIKLLLMYVVLVVQKF